MLPDLLEPAGMTLERGTSLFDGVSRAANMVGAPLAGVLIAVLGATNVLVLDAVTFLVSALLVLACVPSSVRGHVQERRRRATRRSCARGSRSSGAHRSSGRS